MPPWSRRAQASTSRKLTSQLVPNFTFKRNPNKIVCSWLKSPRISARGQPSTPSELLLAKPVRHSPRARLIPQTWPQFPANWSVQAPTIQSPLQKKFLLNSTREQRSEEARGFSLVHRAITQRPTNTAATTKCPRGKAIPAKEMPLELQ